MSQTIRAFIAVEAGNEVRRAAGELIERLRTAGADVKWVAPENLHLTLKFLGDVALTDTARICEAMEKAAREVEPFGLEMAGAGAFPSVGRPRTIWLGASGDDRPILALVEGVEKRLQKLGFRREGRRFQAHLTLGRLRRPGPEVQRLGELLKAEANRAAGTTAVREIVLFSSQLTPDGPLYAPLGRAQLGGA
ncbi:MAG: RNA 2',3'-cyclic phosphodiesterase [Pirellulales bacterium]|nr:RNA 2',3'-cyclic phosphodiesterase [Pirellulales bacterium]